MKRLMAVMLFASGLATVSEAQSLNLRVTIPFEFRAGKQVMPAGEYTLQDHGPWLILRQQDTGRSSGFLISNGVVRSNENRSASVTFHRYGEIYFLSAVWAGYSRDGREVPPTPVEKELARKGGSPSSATILAQK